MNAVTNLAAARQAAAAGLTAQALDEAIATACNRIAPLWPLKHFVAVNPFLGFSGQSFASTCATMRRVTGAEMLMPRAFYAAAIEGGAVTDADLATGLARMPGLPGVPADVATLRAAAACPRAPQRPRAVVATIAETLDRLADGDRQVSRTAFMIDEISKFSAAYFDGGQAPWALPTRGSTPYAAWREAMRHDRNAEMMGITGFRGIVAEMPSDPRGAIALVLADLGVPAHAAVDYLHRALFDIGGWAAYVRYLVWDNGLYGRADDRLVELLAIRVVWGYALFRERQGDPAFTAAWDLAMAEATIMAHDETLGDDPDLAVDLALHHAYEASFERRLLKKVSAAARPAAVAPVGGLTPAAGRPAVQAAFCIDVRSEVFRRALEVASPQVETIGFAGFFGFPIEYVPIGHAHGGAQCPVLLTPAFTVCEAVGGVGPEAEAEVLGLRLLRRRAAKAWKAFKLSAVSSFTYVETAGLGFAAKLLGDSLAYTRPVPDPNLDGLDRTVAAKVGPRLDPQVVGGRKVGFDPEQRLAMAEGVLRAMSMTGNFGRLVLLAGHGSTTVNNPHASGLDCGACGGHTGEANARVAAGILNDPAVREGLVAKGITIPADTWFVGALHDTTTDEVRLYDVDAMPATFARDLAALRAMLAEAGKRARAERAGLLNIADGADIDAAVAARARDWSQVRPEWGLAGNAAFIAAPRHRTKGVNLNGRSFLHSYDWRQDAGFGTLTLIMTAPMVVASWINLQYYGSTVNNRAFGAGNKVLHNVTGQLGVLEGNAGDLRVGLPWQSVHDGSKLIHEPMRLNVMIEAPLEAIDAVIAAHGGVRDLIENGWVHLFAIADDGSILRRAGCGEWSAAA